MSLTAFSADEYKGIDVSVWQGDIDFKEVRRDGIEFVYIRAGEGENIVDSKFERNYKKAREEDLKIGFYHYVTARNEREAREQAHFFYSLIKDKRYDLRAAMDFENLRGLSKAECNRIARVYMETLERLLKHKPAFYSSAYDTKEVWERSLNKYPLWVADYGVKKPYTIGKWKRYEAFQYSSRGRVRGIKGHVDLDKFKKGMLLTDDEKDSLKNDLSDYESYTVKEGDTLSEIARRFNMTTEEIIKINDLRLIYPGEKLLVKR